MAGLHGPERGSPRPKRVPARHRTYIPRDMTKHTLTLAHSPDSDDMVMWWPLAGMVGPDGVPAPGEEGRPAIVSERFAFRTIAEDIERLNRRAIEVGDLDTTAISAHTYPHVAGRYRITACGASMGDGYGPRVVVPADSHVETVRDLVRLGVRVAVPGVRTTAFLVLSLLAGEQGGGHGEGQGGGLQHEEMLFSDVIGAVQSGRCGAGLLIHEAQLNYGEAGLRLIADLGAVWKSRTGLPLPLGLNVVRRDLDERFGAGSEKEVAMLLESSVRHGRTQVDASRRFLRLHAGGGLGGPAAGRDEWLDDDLLDRYMAMYVNEHTQDMGRRGEEALTRLYADAAAAGLCPDPGPIDVLRSNG